MGEYTTFIVGVALVIGFFCGRACTIWESNEQRHARARMRRAMRSTR